MCVQVIDVSGVDSGISKRGDHRFPGALPIGWRGRYVVGVAAHTKPDQLSEYRRAARFRVLEFLKNNATGTVAQDETVPVHIERPAGLLRFVRVAMLDHAPCKSDAVGGGRAGSDDRYVGPGDVLHDADIAGRHVDNAAGYVER